MYAAGGALCVLTPPQATATSEKPQWRNTTQTMLHAHYYRWSQANPLQMHPLRCPTPRNRPLMLCSWQRCRKACSRTFWPTARCARCVPPLQRALPLPRYACMCVRGSMHASCTGEPGGAGVAAAARGSVGGGRRSAHQLAHATDDHVGCGPSRRPSSQPTVPQPTASRPTASQPRPKRSSDRAMVV